MSKIGPKHLKGVCANCVHFQNDPAALEKAWPGLTSMSSGFASVRAQDGLCNRHDLYLSDFDGCGDFAEGHTKYCSISKVK
jgi:hypothetical protein